MGILSVQNITVFVRAVCFTCRTPHPLAAPQPAARPPGAAPPSAAGRAVAARPATRPAARSERRAPRRPAASPPGRSRSAGPGSADSLKHKFTGFVDYVKLLTGEGKNNKKMTSRVMSTLELVDLLNASLGSSFLLFGLTRVFLFLLGTAEQRRQ